MGRTSDARERLMAAVLELIWTGSYGTTTIDRICARAGVRKGSFYYFFRSKSDLAAAALAADWRRRRPQLDAIFSPAVPPLARLHRFAGFVRRNQAELRKKCGCVLGCPVFSLGAEICTREQGLRAGIQEILGSYRKYFETAVRDAHAAGLIDAPDAAGKARMLLAYYEGLLTQARIQNDVAVLREMARGFRAMLGAGEWAAA